MTSLIKLFKRLLYCILKLNLQLCLSYFLLLHSFRVYNYSGSRNEGGRRSDLCCKDGSYLVEVGPLVWFSLPACLHDICNCWRTLIGYVESMPFIYL